jgi:NAD(P)-dependent dehydrogenase (short-subunit alcohol dehydrogenase family)
MMDGTGRPAGKVAVITGGVRGWSAGVLRMIARPGAPHAVPVGRSDRGTAKGGLATLTSDPAAEYGAGTVRADCLAPPTITTDVNAPIPATVEGRGTFLLALDEATWSSGAVLRGDGGIVGR